MTDRWVPFGWQGLRVEVPEDWELVGIPKEQDPAEGYLRLDDRLYPRLELRWRAHPQRQFDIHKTLDNYLGSVRKTYGRDMEVRRNQNLIPDNAKNATFHQDREALFFSWRGSLQALGLIWRCRLCRRVLMTQVLAPLEEKSDEVRRTALRVFHTLSDHPAGETNLWTAYGLEMDVPRRYRLEKLQLLNAYILFLFSDGVRRVAVERFGLADQQLGDGTLETWFRKTYAKSLRGTFFVLDATEDPPPARLALDGRDVRLVDRVDRWNVGAVDLWDRLFRRRRTAAYAWHDRDANRVYVVRSTGRIGNHAVAASIVRSIPSGAALAFGAEF
jgi:hypothetical protein